MWLAEFWRQIRQFGSLRPLPPVTPPSRAPPTEDCVTRARQLPTLSPEMDYVAARLAASAGSRAAASSAAMLCLAPPSRVAVACAASASGMAGAITASVQRADFVAGSHESAVTGAAVAAHAREDEEEEGAQRDLEDEAAGPAVPEAPPEPVRWPHNVKNMDDQQQLMASALSSEDILPRILKKITYQNAGPVMLTCKLWHDTLKRQMVPRMTQRMNDKFLIIQLDQDPHPIANLYHDFKVNVNWNSGAETLSAVTMLGFEDMEVVTPRQTARMLSQCLNLRELDFWLADIGPEGAQGLAVSLPSLTLLKSLQLSKNRLGPEGMQALAPGMQNLKALQGLALYDNDITADGADACAMALSGLTSLTWLRLGGNCFGAEGAARLVPALAKLKDLQELGFEENALGDNGVIAMLMDWTPGTTLSRLDLTDNFIKETPDKLLPNFWLGRDNILWRMR